MKVKSLIISIVMFAGVSLRAQEFTCDSIDHFFEPNPFLIEDDSAMYLLDTFARQVLYSDNVDLACAFNMFHEYFDKRNLRGEPIRPHINRAIELYDFASFPREHILFKLELNTALFNEYDIERMGLILDSMYLMYRHDTSVFKYADNLSMMAISYSDLEKYEEAEKILKHAIDLTDPLDSFNVFANHYRIALNLHQSGNRERAIVSAMKAEPYLLSSLDDYIKGEFYTFLGVVSNEVDSMEMSARYCHLGLAHTDMPHLKIYLYRALNNVYDGTDSATYYQNKTLDLIDNTGNNLQSHVLREAYTGLLYDFYYARDAEQMKSCIAYFEEAADTIHRVDKEIYWDAQMFNVLLNNLDSEQNWIVNKALSTRDEKNEYALRESNRVLSEEYKETLTKKENEKLRANDTIKDIQLKQSRDTIIGGGVGLFFLGLLSVLLWRQRNNQKRQNQEITKQRNQIKLLNQELNHRVKNNLAFVTALMQMQSRRSTQPEAKEVLKESEQRLMALSKVYASLRSGDSSEIDISQYLSEIVTNLTTAFQSDDKKLNVTQVIVPQKLDAETAMRLGLIINELITNSMKHVQEEEVDIDIKLEHSNQTITLHYQDNGTGIERHLKDSSSSDSMGLQLIKILREQLKGTVDVVLV